MLSEAHLELKILVDFQIHFINSSRCLTEHLEERSSAHFVIQTNAVRDVKRSASRT